MTAVGGPCGLLEKMREDEQWCRWGGPVCKHLVYINGELRTETSYLLWD